MNKNYLLSAAGCFLSEVISEVINIELNGENKSGIFDDISHAYSGATTYLVARAVLSDKIKRKGDYMLSSILAYSLYDLVKYYTSSLQISPEQTARNIATGIIGTIIAYGADKIISKINDKKSKLEKMIDNFR